jgi:uncharacterized protein GlcG (DUF336 family)
MTSITLAQAEQIAQAALAKGRSMQMTPLTVAVLDAGGHQVVLKREDGSGILRPNIAIGKAWGALGMGFNSRTLAQRASTLPQFYAALGDASQGRLVPAAGGVLILNTAHEVIGAVGISGDSSDHDELCGIAGIEAAGLVPRKDQ